MAAKTTTKKTAKKTLKNHVSKETSKRLTTAKPKAPGQPDVPSLFRLNLEVGDIDEAADFYGKLLGIIGRKQAGSRCYFTCGPVTLQVVDVSSSGKPHPAAKALYFTVKDLDAIFERAKALGCLSGEGVHGVSGGQISVRPWGERSFYAEDKWENPLCFVEAGTIYPG
ncbi:MAG TPA: VOC family protein [Blastocatellia bacterium]|nr:VOC family protein [Blastocatellia bacterium]